MINISTPEELKSEMELVINGSKVSISTFCSGDVVKVNGCLYKIKSISCKNIYYFIYVVAMMPKIKDLAQKSKVYKIPFTEDEKALMRGK